eukprot:751540-Hanusia_phi.AAC.4
MQNSKEEQKDRRGEEEMRGGGEGNSEGQENGGKGEQGGVDNGEGSGLLKVTEVKEEARTSIEREDEIREQGKENEIGVEENREADREGWEICRGKGKGAEDNRAVEENRQRTGMGEDNTNEADEKEENTERGQDTREGMEEDTGGVDGILEDEERVTTGTQEHEEHGEGQTKDGWRADHCHSDGDYRSEMDLNGSVSPMQHELATLPTLRHDQQDEGVSFDDEARYNKDDGFADCGDDCQDKGEQRTHSSAFDAGDNAQALLPGSVVCEVSSASMPEGYPEESQLRSFDPPVAASGGERCRSIDVLEIMLSEHSEAGSTEEEPMGKSVAKVKRRKTDGLQNNRASKNHVDRGDENADASVVKPAVRTYKKAAARRTKVKKTHGEHGGDENYEITRMMIVKAELSELRDFSQELVSLELSETEFTDILYPRSRCGWTRSSRGGNPEGENREEQSSTGGNHDQTLYPSSLGQHDALCNKLLEAAKQHIVDLDLKKCNITYKWNDSCTYVGVLGAKNNSQKYQRSDQAWYNVTWDDGSLVGIAPVPRGFEGTPSLHPEVSLVSLSPSVDFQQEQGAQELVSRSSLGRAEVLHFGAAGDVGEISCSSRQRLPSLRRVQRPSHDGGADDCTGEKLRGRKHGLNDKSFHGTNSVLQSPVKQEDAHPAAAGAVVPGSHAVGLWGCRAVDLASQGRRLTDVLTSTASASDQDKLTGESDAPPSLSPLLKEMQERAGKGTLQKRNLSCSEIS